MEDQVVFAAMSFDALCCGTMIGDAYFGRQRGVSGRNLFYRNSPSISGSRAGVQVRPSGSFWQKLAF